MGNLVPIKRRSPIFTERLETGRVLKRVGRRLVDCDAARVALARLASREVTLNRLLERQRDLLARLRVLNGSLVRAGCSLPDRCW